MVQIINNILGQSIYLLLAPPLHIVSLQKHIRYAALQQQMYGIDIMLQIIIYKVNFRTIISAIHCHSRIHWWLCGLQTVNMQIIGPHPLSACYNHCWRWLMGPEDKGNGIITINDNHNNPQSRPRLDTTWGKMCGHFLTVC